MSDRLRVATGSGYDRQPMMARISSAGTPAWHFQKYKTYEKSIFTKFAHTRGFGCVHFNLYRERGIRAKPDALSAQTDSFANPDPGEN
jgi:hypothetical protein